MAPPFDNAFTEHHQPPNWINSNKTKRNWTERNGMETKKNRTTLLNFTWVLIGIFRIHMVCKSCTIYAKRLSIKSQPDQL